MEDEILNFTQAELDYLYNLGVKHIATANYSEALSIFLLLIKVEGKNELYPKALAGCLQAQKKYIEAFFYYQCTYMLNPNKHQDCLFYSGVCLFESNLLEKALSYLNDFCKNPGGYGNLIAKAKLYIKISQDGLTNLS